MECVRAQEIVSSALDRETVDEVELSAAKQHCRTCEECAAFVRALVRVQRAPLPEPPANLVERIMGAVAAEDLRAQRSGAPETVAPKEPDAGVSGPDVCEGAPLSGLGTLKERLLHPRNRRALVAWSAAAAVVFIGAGLGAFAGMRAILSDRGGQQITAIESPQVTRDDGSSAITVPPGSTYPYGSVAGGDATDTDALTLPGDTLIVVDGMVYRFSGIDESVTKGILERRGTTRAVLEEGALLSEHEVLGTSDPSRVFIADEDGLMRAFDRVTTSYAGRTYVLKSAPLTRYGARATLPSDLIAPASPDGAPTFQPVDRAEGASVYVLIGKTASEGIALPPGARTDVADGWSWWEPTPQ